MTDAGSLRIDREVFLVLAAALSAGACAKEQLKEPEQPRQSSDPVQIVEITKPEDGGGAEVTLADDSDAGPFGPDDGRTGGCDNDVGEVDCSDFDARKYTGPACEGVQGMCDGLAERGAGYRLRAAVQIARCFTRVGRRVCSISERNRCYLEGAKTACAEPQYVEPCQGILDKCAGVGKKPNFTLDECVRVMSSMSDRERQWALGASGPSREGCRLMYPVY